jgi:hypothetical protein
MTDTPKIQFTRGDTFKLDVTITDPNSAAALAALALLVIAQANYQAALDADPQVPQDIIDTLALLVTAQANYDTAIIVDITGWTITSKITWCGSAIATFVVTIVSAVAGTFSINGTPAVTGLWKVREHDMDILFVRPEGSTSSEAMIVDVERGPTNG